MLDGLDMEWIVGDECKHHTLPMYEEPICISHRIQRKSQSIIKMKKDEEEEFFLRKLYKKRKAQ